jgi:hypothetical protein
MERQRLQGIKKYMGEFDKVLSARQVARFFQLEMQMQRMVDLQVAAELPQSEPLAPITEPHVCVSSPAKTTPGRKEGLHG